ncbi:MULTISPECIES: bifunctional diaminohydroxyphosphoribosylaminopyrimidine deaminase/5-amino-6-(5-phosphoribosylamino)uracil reductase RibD [unclassified Pseudomonas]|uniref:bifunctional diaminohydroxyphosphoribosylaminopyrimidine deaminase/5-amino-6-(5-phosphoribosylamino)uracil reductase RibD n=1 Tax=unclassified Pseudomonas TaxID=196821 RepID=UPI0021C8AC97|nr:MULTISPECIES: bifunctional diaminohydroxyphosphoribosylaminopyrimidine deaminase/5-amino-6-(5-phosphoribosylamino)uracil reductase RibD [unclassified Pseudomonas]MCU1731371.1 bifunctional diaminohydroxyphosphoribosylaminopyrimidine deaminase/5-amino-6-(5-phosphoribosylamino)uracil reductase RibD [Pseudomonas sp. 20P_3.2_Bac4]MCU1746893.1 bifunctional diaminohydroxyphosphoribosylaminopyrimidine deaminase/5-amino-6-(5-phosphoribosylamino)uracil reductase RibD [Pseudomonas sp. 20P_3.2_Bac5]
MSTERAVLDAHYMARALELARKGLYSTHPNPRVGCVIVRDGEVVGEGWHVRAGEPHAEVHALRQAGELARGACAYVTLEPCSHHGRTPPCAEALVKAGVARVVAAMQDPNPQVAGNGLKRLADAGIEVASGVLEAEARALNPGFLKRMEHGLPYVRVKLAMSLDGRTAMASGESQWITGPAARSAVQRLRARSSVVLSSASSVLADNARMTVRGAELGLDADTAALALSRPPLRVLIDGRLRLPLDAPFYQAGPALVVTAAADDPRYAANGQELLRLPGADGQVDLRQLLVELAGRGVNEVLVEAGPGLAGAFAQLGLVDEYQLFIAGKFLGSSARPLLDWPLARMSEAPALKITDMRAVGDDWRVTAIPVPAPGV